jgi:glycine cleavage system H protein
MSAPRTPPSRPGSPGGGGAQSPAPRCVWMSAGVLSYWLCPRQFDCENCVLDGLLSGREPTLLEAGFPDDGEVVLHHAHHQGWLAHLSVPLRRRRGLWYHPAHVWGRAIGPGRVRLGLDDIAARLLADSEPWSLPEVGSTITAHDALGRTRVGGASVRVASPLPGRIVARNAALRRHPKLATWSPYDAGWLVEMTSDVRLCALAGFMRDEAVVSHWFERELDRLEACVPAEVRAGELGETLADGGTPRGSLRQLLGDDGFGSALHTVFPFGD